MTQANYYMKSVDQVVDLFVDQFVDQFVDLFVDLFLDQFVLYAPNHFHHEITRNFNACGMSFDIQSHLSACQKNMLAYST